MYAKNDAFYKDNKVKETKWKVIAETLNCTGRLKYFIFLENETVEYLSQDFYFVVSEAKMRWDSLRNQFSRKLRQQKIQPSGSGQASEWPLMSCMSFLKSHIQNRKYVYFGSLFLNMSK